MSDRDRDRGEQQGRNPDHDDHTYNSDESADESSHPICPNCGEPMLTLAVNGPTAGVVGPCGCRVDPSAALERGLAPGPDSDSGRDSASGHDRETESDPRLE